MRILLYIVILALMLLAPVQRLDIAKLQPIEAVAMDMENGLVIITTDTDDRGAGETAQEALADMKRRASAIIYLDTAKFLLVAEEAQAYTGEIKAFLKPSVKTGIYNGGDVKEEAKYLDVHADRAKPNG